MMTGLPDLPVKGVLAALLSALAEHGRVVLVAPPGAGKTTVVPLALLGEGWATGRILLLEPRRLAARAAARRMAELLGEEVGDTVGYAMRLDTRISDRTRILVVTEGVLSRMILDDPELSEVSAVIFDEFHERSLDGDFGLALALDVQGALRPDLKLVVMSATIDGSRVAGLLGDAPVVESAGRTFPVEVRYRDPGPTVRVEDAVLVAISDVLAEEKGSVLAFLPGQAEISRVAERLAARVATGIDIMPLYGAMDGREQDAAIMPSVAGRRKVVLATAIAETSITIDGVRIVIDSGWSRLPRFEPSTGLTRLQTVRVSRASADQRAGRAGRTEPGIAVRLWRCEQTPAFPAFAPPEIHEADLSGLVLDCAAFGVTDPSSLGFLDAPPAPALAEARSLLVRLAAIDPAGRITDEGRAMRRLRLPVRLAHMVSRAATTGHSRQAAELAVLLTERGLGGSDIDLDVRIGNLRSDRGARARAARDLAGALARTAGGKPTVNSGPVTVGSLLIHAWPDRVAKARGEPGRYVLAGGRGVELDPASPLAREPYLVVADLQGSAGSSRMAAAAAVSEQDIVDALGNLIERREETTFDAERSSVRVRQTVNLGAIVLRTVQKPAPTGPEADRAVIGAVRENGLSILPWDKASTQLRTRLGWLRSGLGEPWPDVGDDRLLAGLDIWLEPFLTGLADLSRISASALRDGLMSLVPPELQRKVDILAPTHFTAPSGSHLPIRYESDPPVLAVRVQELFGLDRHPSIAGGRIPLTLELLSPAHRPIQTTGDLPGFWRGSWAEVRADMRGRYPRHEWPEYPLVAKPTSRAKPRAK